METSVPNTQCSTVSVHERAKYYSIRASEKLQILYNDLNSSEISLVFNVTRANANIDTTSNHQTTTCCMPPTPSITTFESPTSIPNATLKSYLTPRFSQSQKKFEVVLAHKHLPNFLIKRYTVRE